MASRLRSRLAVWLHGVACPLLDNTARAGGAIPEQHGVRDAQCHQCYGRDRSRRPVFQHSAVHCWRRHARPAGPARALRSPDSGATMGCCEQFNGWQWWGIWSLLSRLLVFREENLRLPRQRRPNWCENRPYIQVHPWRWHCAAGQARFTINPVDAHHIIVIICVH